MLLSVAHAHTCQCAVTYMHVVLVAFVGRYPVMPSPYAMDIHSSAVTCLKYFSDCVAELIPAFYSCGTKQKRKISSRSSSKSISEPAVCNNDATPAVCSNDPTPRYVIMMSPLRYVIIMPPCDVIIMPAPQYVIMMPCLQYVILMPPRSMWFWCHPAVCDIDVTPAVCDNDATTAVCDNDATPQYVITMPRSLKVGAMHLCPPVLNLLEITII